MLFIERIDFAQECVNCNLKKWGEKLPSGAKLRSQALFGSLPTKKINENLKK